MSNFPNSLVIQSLVSPSEQQPRSTITMDETSHMNVDIVNATVDEASNDVKIEGNTLISDPISHFVQQWLKTVHHNDQES